MNNKDNKNNSTISKKSVVLTPDFVAKNIYDNVKRFPFKKVLDVGCFNGNLSKFFGRKKNVELIGLDIDDEYKDNFDKFLHLDFINCKKEDFDFKPDLILTNPPFGRNQEFNALYPDLFLKKIFELWGKNIPVIMIAGHWFLSNSSSRIEFLNSCNITKTTTLHKRTFENCDVSVEASILYFNIKQKIKYDILDVQKVEKKQQFKTVAFSHKQIDYISNNIENFSGEVKNLLKEKYKDFPI